MGAALLAEYRKIVTTRLWWILLLVMAVYMGFISAVMAWAVSQGDVTTNAGGQSEPVVLAADAVVRSVYTITVSFGYVFPVIVGALAMSSEFRHKTVTPTFLAEPRRSVVLGAKLAAAGAVGLLFGVVGTLASAGVGAAVLGILGKPTYLDVASTWRTLGLSVVALAVWSLVGVGFGTLVTNQVAVIVALLAFTQFVEPVARFVLVLTSWGKSVAKFLPGAAGEGISGGSFYSEAGLASLLPSWAALLVLLGYAVAFAVIGRLVTLRRDIT